MLLCLSPAWLMKVGTPGQEAEAALLVSKAVSFYPGGLTFLDDFVPPRHATYFLAGLGPESGHGRVAAELARNLTCPTGASAELAQLLENRLLMRWLLSQQSGVAVPATLAFTYRLPGLLRGGDASPGLRLVELSGKEGQETLVKEEVEAFVHSKALGDASQVTQVHICTEVLWDPAGWSPCCDYRVLLGNNPKFLALPPSHFSIVPCAFLPQLTFWPLWHEQTTFRAHEVVVRRVPSLFCCRWL